MLPYNRRQQVLSGGQLVINDISRTEDRGEYICIASNKQGHTASQPLRIKVVGKFTFLYAFLYH